MAKCKCCGQEIPEIASERFKEFWAVWPVKTDKIAAVRKWRTKKLDAIADKIIAHVRYRLENDPRWKAGYVMGVEKFLNRELWEDEIDTIPRPEKVKEPTKNEDWVVLGEKYGVRAGLGEGWPQFKDRVRRAMEKHNA